MAYYSLMHIGELTSGMHPVRAKDIHIGHNKDKILLFLYTSKTHGKESGPQEIKISAAEYNTEQVHFTRFFCPFIATRKYTYARGNFDTDTEPFFIFADGTPVEPKHV